MSSGENQTNSPAGSPPADVEQLLASVAAGFFGLLAKSKLPKLYHPVFEADAFERASRDRFVICVEASDPAFDPASVRSAFEQLGAETIEEVRA